MWTFLFVDLPIMEISYEVRNEHHLVSENPCVIVSNHQSSLDVIGEHVRGGSFSDNCTTFSRGISLCFGTSGPNIWLQGPPTLS